MIALSESNFPLTPLRINIGYNPFNEDPDTRFLT